MQINNATTFTPQSAQTLGVDKQSQVNNSRDRLVVQEDQKKTEQDSSQKKQQNRLDIDPQAIALVAQNQQLNAKQNTQSNNNPNAVQSEYDQPSRQNKTAVSAYQSVDNIAQRDSVQQSFGVDFYA